MSRLLGGNLPDDLLARLGAGGGTRFEHVILLVSVDENSFPHVAMLSRWEAVAKDERELRIAVYSDSRTARYLLLNGKTTMIFVNEKMSYYVKGTARLLMGRMAKDPANSMFGITVNQVFEDSMPGARIVSGIAFDKSAGTEPHEALYSELAGG